MKIKDLIEKLKEIEEDHGDVDVLVQYPDRQDMSYDDDTVIDTIDHIYIDWNDKNDEKILIIRSY